MTTTTTTTTTDVVGFVGGDDAANCCCQSDACDGASDAVRVVEAPADGHFVDGWPSRSVVHVAV